MTVLTLSEVKSLYKTIHCHETENCFLVHDYGKYKPNVTFVLSKDFHLNKDRKPIDPLSYTTDSKITDNMNIPFDGDADFIFGDFWINKKGNKCFKPEDPLKSKHLLIRVSWGGSYSYTWGNYRGEKIKGVIYFHRASSNAVGSGYDYYIVPVRFKNKIFNIGLREEISKLNYERRKMHSNQRKNLIREAEILLDGIPESARQKSNFEESHDETSWQASYGYLITLYTQEITCTQKVTYKI